ncbi:MAG TPA: helix-turn-helix domain-containing protein [Gemmataceae bacterium]|nr:helix-turn-helix domain-containing protein [Gemmataceae bacterium]
MAAKTKPAKKSPKRSSEKNGKHVAPDVMTLAEAAAFLRVTEDDIVTAATTQGLPGRKVGGEWRFSQSSLQAWLNEPQRMSGKEALLAMAGKFKDDPDLEGICEDAYRERGRPITEDDE